MVRDDAIGLILLYEVEMWWGNDIDIEFDIGCDIECQIQYRLGTMYLLA